MHTKWLRCSIAFPLVCLSPWGCRSPEGRPGDLVAPSPLDETEIKIESAACADLLGAEKVKVRNRLTAYRPKGPVEVVRLAEVTDTACRDVLNELIRRYSPDARVYYRGDILTAEDRDAFFWVSRASGAFKYTQRQTRDVAIPSEIGLDRAIQIALDHLGQKRLIRLGHGEEVDILFVSETRNKATHVDGSGPIAQFTSDRYVGFGRRYRGIPVIGSMLVVRLDGRGAVRMVSGNWRKIEPASGRFVPVRDEPIEELVVNSPEFRKRFPDQPIEPSRLTILDMKCGYIEGPANVRQTNLQPGCQVAYRVGDRRDEEASELTVNLEIEGGLGPH
jgi:hypothetical protein